MISQRCKKCGIKNILVAECRCGSHYCTKHRLPEIHECVELGQFKKEAYDKNMKTLTVEKDKVEWV